MKKNGKLQWQILTALMAGSITLTGIGLAEAAEADTTNTANTELAAPAEAAPAAAVADFGDEDVVVTAAAMPTKIAATPANVTIITAQEIEDNHYQTVGDALEQVNGVTVTKMGGGNVEYVRLNGDDRVVVMIDGQRVNTEQGAISGKAGVDLSMFPIMNNIQKIEVVKGGASALYGSDAVGGVINIITKKADKNQTEIDLSYGSQNAHKYMIKNQGKAGDFSWQIGAGLDGRNDFKFKHAGSSYTMDNSNTDNNNFFVRLDQQLTNNSSLQLNFSHKSEYTGLYKFNGNTVTNNGYMQSVYNNTSLTYKFKEDTSAPGYVRYYYTAKNMHYFSERDAATQGIDYQNGWQLDKDNILVAGAELHWSKAANKSAGYDDNLSNQSFYVQDTVTAGKWTLIPGVRMDHHSKYGTHWSPKIALNYQADNKTQLYGNYGRVFKAPTSDDLFWYEDWGYGTGMFGSQDLKPETGWTADFGINHAFSEKSSVGIRYFTSEISNAIRFVDLGGWNFHAQNIDKEKKHGLELSFKQIIDNNWSYNLGYSYIHSETNGEFNPDNMMPNGYKIGVNYKNKDFRASLQGNIGSGLTESKYVNRGYNLWNLNLNYDFNANVTGYLQALNLTNSEHYTYAYNNNSYYPAAGRTFMVGVNVKF